MSQSSSETEGALAAAVREKVLHVQIQLAREPSLDEARLMDLLLGLGRRECARRVSQSKGEDDGRWIGFSYNTGNLGQVWSAVRETVLGDAVVGALVARAAIVVCQGDAGWDDYLLLHHFDPLQPLDQLRGGDS